MTDGWSDNYDDMDTGLIEDASSDEDFVQEDESLEESEHDSEEELELAQAENGITERELDKNLWGGAAKRREWESRVGKTENSLMAPPEQDYPWHSLRSAKRWLQSTGASLRQRHSMVPTSFKQSETKERNRYYSPPPPCRSSDDDMDDEDEGEDEDEDESEDEDDDDCDFERAASTPGSGRGRQMAPVAIGVLLLLLLLVYVVMMADPAWWTQETSQVQSCLVAPSLLVAPVVIGGGGRGVSTGPNAGGADDALSAAVQEAVRLCEAALPRAQQPTEQLLVARLLGDLQVAAHDFAAATAYYRLALSADAELEEQEAHNAEAAAAASDVGRGAVEARACLAGVTAAVLQEEQEEEEEVELPLECRAAVRGDPSLRPLLIAFVREVNRGLAAAAADDDAAAAASDGAAARAVFVELLERSYAALLLAADQ